MNSFFLIIYGFLTIIFRNYYGQKNRLYLQILPDELAVSTPNTNFVIPQNSDISIKTQHSSADDASVGAHYVASYGLDQSTNHHSTMYVKYNYDSHSFDMHRKNSCISSSFGDTITAKTTPRSYTLTPPGKEHLCFQTEVKTVWAEKCAKARALIKVLKSIFEIDSFKQQCVIIKGY